MPTIEVSKKDLCRLVGKKLKLEQIEGLVGYAKAEVESTDGDMLRVEIKDTNRPDLWSAEGIAREIKGRLGRGGLPIYKVRKSKVVVKVDKKVSKVRPLTVCAVAKGVKFDQYVLSQLIQLQEKVSVTFGRNRREVAIGVYDLHKIKSPISYTTVKPDGIKFVPLEFTKEMTPKEILERHPKGREFGHLLKGCDEYPMFIDSARNVLSIPPIINSDYTGKVTEKTKDVFIECSGFNFKFLVPALNILVSALADRGARIETVTVVYPDGRIRTPDLSPKKSSVAVDYANKVSGLELKPREMCKLLEEARYKTRLKKNKIEVLYPAYRQDIMHQRDVAEDVIVSYGYNNIIPEIPEIPTIGSLDEKETFSSRVAEAMTGLGMQEILSYTLTNKENLFKKMNISETGIAEIENPASMNWSVFRNWMLPGIMDFLSQNQHVECPQRVFEIGDVVVLDESQETRTKNTKRVVCAIANSKATYEELSSVLDALLSNLGLKYQLKAFGHNSFIGGRAAEIIVNRKSIGFIGEVSPEVLSNWKIEMPVVAFEMDLEEV
jgi:phenylalanyl-tRNA synthetase beta chain